MGEFEKIRVQEIRTKKLRDDKLNRQREAEKHHLKQFDIQKGKKDA